MEIPQLDLSSLERAVGHLRVALEEHKLDAQRPILQAGLIQTFEYNYELSHKMLRRYLVSISASPEEVEALNFADLIRIADDAGLVASPIAVWRKYREARSITSHTYNEDKAAQVINVIPAFYDEASYLLRQLQEKSQASNKREANQ